MAVSCVASATKVHRSAGDEYSTSKHQERQL